jgi:hypothetical protein
VVSGLPHTYAIHRAVISAAIVRSNAQSARKALASTASGSYRRPKLVAVDRYDPDAVGVEPVRGNRGQTMNNGGFASG